MANRKKRSRFSKIEANLEALEGNDAPAGTAMDKLQRQRRGDPTMKSTIDPQFRKENGELLRQSVPIVPFNIGMPATPAATIDAAAALFVRTPVTYYAVGLIKQCTSVNEALLGWVFEGGATGSVTTEELRNAIKPNPNFLPAILLPSYKREDDTGTTTPSKYYAGKTYRKYDKRAAQIPFGRKQAEGGLPSNEGSEEGRKTVLITALKTAETGFKAGSCGYDSEEFMVSEGGNFAWLDWTDTDIPVPFA